MDKISKSVKKKDHDSKIAGRALYVDDRKVDGMLYGKILRSTYAKAKIKNIHIPKLPGGYVIVDKDDVPGENKVAIVDVDTPVYADGKVEYIGEAILMVAGPDEKETERIRKSIVVDYEEEEPILDILKSDTVFYHYQYEKGDCEQAFSEADKVIEEVFGTGYQEQAYLETQGVIAYSGDEQITVSGSLQCPYYIHGALCKVFGYAKDQVQVQQDDTGGGFGGKEDYPSILACQVAVAAKKTGRPVKVIFERREDFECTSKRHPSLCTYRVAMKDGKITAMDIDVKFNSGAYTTLSPVVLQRGVICASGVYDIPNLRVEGRAIKTNTTPCGAFRGFGAPQTFFAVEMLMDHLAGELNMDSLALKEMYMVKQGDTTSTSGNYHFHVPLPEMIERIDQLCDYRKKRADYRNQTGRYQKGIGLSMFFHGCGFTGSGERDMIKAVCRLHKAADDRVLILGSNTDIGQGIKTTFCKIVADSLNVPLEQVTYNNPDTCKVPDSGPTVASRSLMIVGELLRRASLKLKEIWISGQEQEIEEHYKEPDFMIPFNLENFQGDAYPTYSWSVNAIEVEVDTLTAMTKVTGAWGIFDVGVPIDYHIVKGQMEGGYVQGIGYASSEKMDYDQKGRIRNNSFSDYTIPTSMDIPNLQVEILNNPYTHGPYGAKGAGELPLVGAAPAYAEAMEQALSARVCHIPFTPEDTMQALQGQEVEKA
jgi:CO/xanthine dehydrogenase Mo-binding subunit